MHHDSILEDTRPDRRIALLQALCKGHRVSPGVVEQRTVESSTAVLALSVAPAQAHWARLVVPELALPPYAAHPRTQATPARQSKRMRKVQTYSQCNLDLTAHLAMPKPRHALHSRTLDTILRQRAANRAPSTVKITISCATQPLHIRTQPALHSDCQATQRRAHHAEGPVGPSNSAKVARQVPRGLDADKDAR